MGKKSIETTRYGECLKSKNIEAVATLRHITVSGVCGQKFSMSVDEWRKFKRKIDREIRMAKKRAMENPFNKALIPGALTAGLPSRF